MSTNDFMGSVRNNWRQRAREMTTFQDEFRIVPRWLLTLIVVLYLVALAVGEFMNVAGSRGIIPGGMFAPQLGLALSGLALAGLITAGVAFGGAFILLIAYIYVDARRRGMHPAVWAAIAVFIPYLIGIVIYFIIREPLPFNCPQCAAKVNAHYNFCPRCQFNLRPNCPQCRREIRAGDRYCPYCGAGLESSSAGRPSPMPVSTV